MKKMDIALEWFLNPDHLPLIVGIHEGWFAEAGYDVNLIIPDEHYDGLASVAAGSIPFACNEPLHMVDEPRPGLRALGCFFETEGGVLLHRTSADRLLRGEPIRLASPVAGGITDRIAREILQRWAAKQGKPVLADSIAVESAGFRHIDNMRNGFDGSWLCFANFEAVEARLEGLDCLFVTTAMAGLPNFSALELFTHERLLAEDPEAAAAVAAIISRGATACVADPAYAARVWYAYTGSSPGDRHMDAVLADTAPRLVSPVARDAGRWRGMWRALRDLGLATADEAAYDALYS
jgi:ABC-type nitrate/sulfonate/bicarbonate transport system substrate-binding protein